MNRVLYYFLVALGAGLVLYLSWRSHPIMGQVWFIPKPIAHWADQRENDTIRTAVPFVLLGLVVGGQLAWQHQLQRHWLTAWGALVGLVVLAEAGQHFQADRSFDVADIAWGAAGAAVGLGIIGALQLVYFLLRKMGNSFSS